MSRHLIGAGIALSLLGWGVGRVGDVTLAATPRSTVAADKAALPHFSVHLSIEVRP
ncbi:hypothetical protein [Sphingomonas sp. GM_Shp_1]|uniref:hypothetical protein n=1 Tax=Sphingomonas sp. GM_Shp_1 TaxID=2937381 RepID=UPI00226B39C8|nr:hypothetical protein [Sphingomonas sp. GM_Shp_1]